MNSKELLVKYQALLIENDCLRKEIKRLYAHPDFDKLQDTLGDNVLDNQGKELSEPDFQQVEILISPDTLNNSSDSAEKIKFFINRLFAEVANFKPFSQ